jgi:high-affinity iron transporter
VAFEEPSPPLLTTALLITLRETVEASLVIGIVLACLDRLQARQERIFVWMGIVAGALGSLCVAVFARVMLRGFEGEAEALVEGFTMLLAAVLITWMLLWMLWTRTMFHQTIERDVTRHVALKSGVGLFLLSATSVLREGTETVLFLQAALMHAGAGMQVLGGILGIVLALGASYALFCGIRFLSLRRFFAVTSVLLMLFAAGLLAHAVHEFQEIGYLPFFVGITWDIGNVLPDTEGVGALLRAILGYNANPTWGEVMIYVAYVCAVGLLWRQTVRCKKHRLPV